MSKIYEWETVYKLALDEKDPAKVPARISAAEKSISDQAAGSRRTAHASRHQRTRVVAEGGREDCQGSCKKSRGLTSQSKRFNVTVSQQGDMRCDRRSRFD